MLHNKPARGCIAAYGLRDSGHRNSAAVSASARSLRRRSRSSSLIRWRSARVACRLARASSGAASAAVALACHLSNSVGHMPCSRHHALLAASDTAAVAITVSIRVPAAQACPRAGLDCASSRQRSSVQHSNAHFPLDLQRCAFRRQQPLSLNACPYRATVFLHRRPRVLGLLERQVF